MKITINKRMDCFPINKQFKFIESKNLNNTYNVNFKLREFIEYLINIRTHNFICIVTIDNYTYELSLCDTQNATVKEIENALSHTTNVIETFLLEDVKLKCETHTLQFFYADIKEFIRRSYKIITSTHTKDNTDKNKIIIIVN